MTDQPSEDAEGLHLLGEMWLGFGELIGRSTGVPPQAGSIRRADTARTAPQRSPGWVASWSLNNALDAARACAKLWHAGEVHFLADYTLLRAVVENAGVAWWILHPADSDERIRRAHRVTFDDLDRGRTREQSTIPLITDEAQRDARIANVRRVNELIGELNEDFNATSIPRGTGQNSRLSMAQIMTDAQNNIAGVPNAGFTLLWSMLSSAAHGSLTTVAAFARDDFRPTVLDPSVNFLGTNPSRVRQVGWTTSVLLEAACLAWSNYADVPETD